MKFVTLLVFAIMSLSSTCLQAETYKLKTRYPVGDIGSWDYITVDNVARRLYVSHGTQVNVLDADSGKPIGVIENTLGVHGIVIASDGQRGFTSNGKEDTVSVFNTRTLALIEKIKVGKGPDSIYFEPVSQRVFTSNQGSHDMTVIDAATGKVVGTIEAKGDGEGSVSTSAGRLFVNQEDTSEVVEIDAKTLEVKHRFAIDGGKTPTGLAFDLKNNRLFIACRSKVLVVMNAQDGKTVATVPIGAGTDAAGFDAEAGLIFVSNGDGTLNVIRQKSPDQYESAQQVATQQGAKTMAFDKKTKRVFLPAAEFDVIPGADPSQKPRRTMKEGTFAVLVVGEELVNLQSGITTSNRVNAPKRS